MGTPVVRNRYTYIAAKPFWAEHPVGSGIRVDYNPGDEVPAGEWGRAADNMVEMGKIFRTSVVEFVDSETGALIGGDGGAGDGAPEGAEPPAADEAADVGEQTGSFPRKAGGGYWELSDGSKVRGKAAAETAQAELDAATGA